MKKIFPLSFLLLIGVLKNGYSQVVTIYPVFPTITDSITVIFDATQGNAALAGYTGAVYAHAGLILAPAQNSGWNYTQDNWATDDPKTKMTSLGNNKYKISYRITTFYGVPPTTTVYWLAFVFRDVTGNIVGRTASGGDIFYQMWNGKLSITNLVPYGNEVAATLDSAVSLKYYSSEAGTISLTDNGSPATQQMSTDSLIYSYPATQSGIHQLIATIQTTDSSASDTLTILIPSSAPIAALPAGIKPGINYLDDSTATLCIVAPHKNNIYVLGDFNNWLPDTSYFMYMTPDSQEFWKTIHKLVPHKLYTYQYLIDGLIKVGDEYCDEVSDPDNDPFIPASVYPNLPVYPAGKTTGIASVLETAQTPYQWNDAGYTKPDEHNLVIYELLVRDFVATHSYHTLIDTLHYLKQLGVNAIELMPINEFEGNDGWGYNPNYFFAPDKYYGPKDSLRRFINVCHQNGIAVIQDIALDHAFGSCPLVLMYDNSSGWPSADNPWLNADSDPNTAGYQAPHPGGVGYDINHESPYTRRFTIDVCRYWLNQYHIDGFRFDWACGFTQTKSLSNYNQFAAYDQSRINTMSYYRDSILKTNPDAYLILEYFMGNTEEKILANEGFMLWGYPFGVGGDANMPTAYEQAAMGYATGPNWDITPTSYKNVGWNNPNVVGYMESHDEERLMYKNEQYGNSNSTYNVQPVDTGLDRIKLCATVFFSVPGPKMFWMFQEVGYDYTICYPGTPSLNCDRLADKPVRWDYYANPPRLRLYKWYEAMIHLKHNYPNVFNSANFNFSGADSIKYVTLTGDTMDAVAIGNFWITTKNGTPGFQHIGTWYDYADSIPFNVTTTSQVVTLKAGEYHVFTDKPLPKPDLEVLTGINPITKKNATIPILYDPFPNPAAQTVTFTTYSPAITTAKISVYDMNGKIIATLFDGQMLQGVYITQWDVSKLPQGNYYVQMITALGAQSKKLIIVK